MKHYLMTFLILFSALSSSWALAVFPSVQLNDSSTTEQVTADDTALTLAHSDCPSMGMTEPEHTEEGDCPNCLDNCQCDHNSCQKMNSPLVGVSLSAFNQPTLIEVSVAFVSSSLKNAPIFLDFRPPKIS